MAKKRTVIEIDGPWKDWQSIVTSFTVQYVRSSGRRVVRSTAVYWPAYVSKVRIDSEHFLSTLSYFIASQLGQDAAGTYSFVRLIQGDRTVYVYRGTPEEIAVLRMTRALEGRHG